ncbi:hypothetical protein [Streptomyces sp. NPDC002851]
MLPHRSRSAPRRLLAAFVALLLVGCLSGALASSASAMGSPCPPSEAVAAPAGTVAASHDTPDGGPEGGSEGGSAACASAERCLPVRAEAACHVPLPALDGGWGTGSLPAQSIGPRQAGAEVTSDRSGAAAPSRYALGVIRT